MRKIALLGSTGSIGVSTLDVVGRNRDKFSVEAMSAGKNTELLREQIKKFSPKAVCVEEKSAVYNLKSEFPKTKFHYGDEGLIEIVKCNGINTLVSAITGTIPLQATIEAIREGHRICLANKETLVAAGSIIRKELRKSNSELLPIDSEQSAIFQSIGNDKKSQIKRIILTASGGPFHQKSLDDFKSISVKDALNHPTWNMGTKITIDSATLMNKALEIIEAYYLFDLKPEQIDAIIHPQSIVHSMVEFIDSSTIAQLSLPDMRIPILYSLSYPERVEFKHNNLDFKAFNKLEFFEIDKKKFSSIDMAYYVMKTGKNSGAIFNAANEVAVEYFLKEKISFLEIFKIVEKVLSNSDIFELEGIDSVLETIRITKIKTKETITEK